MTKDELISKQQIEIENYKIILDEHLRLKNKIRFRFYAIGQPLNDNVLNFNQDQIKWCLGTVELIDNMIDGIEDIYKQLES